MLSHTAFTSYYQGPSNVLINKVFISCGFTPPTGPIKKPAEAKEYNAIWDTGATNCVISKKVIDECGLKPIGMTIVKHAQGENTTQVYLGGIFLPNQIAFPQWKMIEGVIANADVLIGMDIIGRGDFVVTNKDGKTVFSFRTPSCECIDFVKQLNENRAIAGVPIKAGPKIGRNNLCTCGSGKKYKHCCGKT